MSTTMPNLLSVTSTDFHRRDISALRRPSVRTGIGAGLRQRRGLLVAALAATIAVSAGWMWLGAAALLPLLYSLPCVAMMAMCMKGRGASMENTVGPIATSINPDSGLSQ